MNTKIRNQYTTMFKLVNVFATVYLTMCSCVGYNMGNYVVNALF